MGLLLYEVIGILESTPCILSDFSGKGDGFTLLLVGLHSNFSNVKNRDHFYCCRNVRNLEYETRKVRSWRAGVHLGIGGGSSQN